MRVDTFLALLVACIVLALALPTSAGAQGAHARSVVVNRVQLSDAQVVALERRYRVRVRDGIYWYDAGTGAWGLQGGPTAGFIAPGLPLGGRLRADASNGNTGVFINGRQLHWIDVANLSKVTRVIPGRYWMDGYGNFGYEGRPMLANIHALARASNAPRQRQGILSTYDKTGAVVIGP